MTTSGSGSGSGTTDTGEGDSGDLGAEDGLDLAGCDLLADPLDACGPDMACDPQTLTCVPANGSGLVDEPCVADGECTPGLVCFDGRCRELCGPGIPGEDQCEGGRVCTHANAPLPGMCLEPCLLLTQICSSVGDACNLAIGSGELVLSVCTANPGFGVDGDTCELDGDCLPGYLCTPAAVHTLPCTNQGAACCSPTCDTFEKVCLGVEPSCHLLGIADQPSAGYCGP